jgi:DMSO/TMAO reductase YedYZ molybdopterin-dependent catalytic subunit
MTRRTLRIVLALGLLLAMLAGCGSGAPNVDWKLKVTGAVETPLTLSYADLAAMPQVELNDVLSRRTAGRDLEKGRRHRL